MFDTDNPAIDIYKADDAALFTEKFIEAAASGNREAAFLKAKALYAGFLKDSLGGDVTEYGLVTGAPY